MLIKYLIIHAGYVVKYYHTAIRYVNRLNYNFPRNIMRVFAIIHALDGRDCT